MAPAIITCILLTSCLLLQSRTSTADFFSPLVSADLDNVCKDVECGKGTCKPSDNSTFLFECVCEPGWKQTAGSDRHNAHKFLPCVIPNCTLNYSCTEAPPPDQDRESRVNTSVFDPCHWSNCGGGTCNKTSLFTYSCECKEGYSNLLNFSALPCFKECSIGADCTNLGITLRNESTSPPPSLAENGTNQAYSIAGGRMDWLIILAIFLASVGWK
ncbi:hypothetical protein NMG60_11025355 [Bertholletia excelsa]